MSTPTSLTNRERARLFCALRLPDEIVEQLVRWQAKEIQGGRPVSPQNLHITLAFLGSRPVDELPRIIEEVRAAAANADTPILGLRGYRETPRVGMLVLEEQSPVTYANSLAVDIQQRMERLGIPLRERSPWKAHITVVRFADRLALTPDLPDLGVFSPSEAAVYISELRPSGAQYDVLESVALGG